MLSLEEDGTDEADKGGVVGLIPTTARAVNGVLSSHGSSE